MLAKPDFQSIENIFIAMLVWLGINIVMQVCAAARSLKCPHAEHCNCTVIVDTVLHAHFSQFEQNYFVFLFIVLQEWFDHHRLVDTTIFFFAFG